MAIPKKEGVIVHGNGNHQAAVLHQYPETPWNDEVEYKFSLKPMAGFLFNRVFGKRKGEVKI